MRDHRIWCDPHAQPASYNEETWYELENKQFQEEMILQEPGPLKLHRVMRLFTAIIHGLIECSREIANMVRKGVSWCAEIL